jgi:hypothetical protein
MSLLAKAAAAIELRRERSETARRHVIEQECLEQNASDIFVTLLVASAFRRTITRWTEDQRSQKM